MKNRAEKFLSDMTYNTRFQFLEESKDKKELIQIAEKRGIKLPSHDLAVFKGTYAYVDRMNKNGCTLPKEEVEKALDTLVGKPVDFDHLRKNVVGYWIDSEINDDEITAYGIFFKSNFEEDFDLVKKLFDSGNLGISFEAWGDREFDESGEGYDLTDIEFAGGALLIKTEPAFDGAGVLEMARKEKVLEFAKVMTKPKEFVHSGKEEKKSKEEARMFSFDMDMVHRAIAEVENLDGESKGIFDILSIDFEKNKVKVRDIPTGGELMIDLTPNVTVTKKGKSKAIAKIEDLTAINTIENMDEYIKDFDGSDQELSILIEQSMEGPRLSHTERLELSDDDFAIVKQLNTEKGNKKITLFPIHSLAHINCVIDRLEQSQVEATIVKLGIEKDTVQGKILRKANELKMKELLEKLQKSSLEEVLQELAKAHIDRDLTEDELEKAYSIVEVDESKGMPSDQSLLKIPTKKSQASPQSLVNAEDVSEDSFKKVIDEATKVEKTDEEKAKEAEEAKKADEEARKKAIEEAKDEKDKEIAELKDSLAKANEKVDAFEKAQKDAKIKERKDILGEEFAKDVSDEDILNDKEFEILKLKKENADLRAGKKVETKTDLSKGSKDKSLETAEAQKRKKIDEYAFGRKTGNSE